MAVGVGLGVWLAVGYWRAVRGRPRPAGFWWGSAAYNAGCGGGAVALFAYGWGREGVAPDNPALWLAAALVAWCASAAVASGRAAVGARGG